MAAPLDARTRNGQGRPLGAAHVIWLAVYDAAVRVRGLPPVEGRRVLVLVLGTMPGAPSLRARRYYANPRNAFWHAADAVGAGPDLPYATRCRRLKAQGIALWDVLASCERKGSLDTAIRAPRPHDFAAFRRRHPELRRILFNGTKARALFDRLVPPLKGVQLTTLPSTSPANAIRGKIATWRGALRIAAKGISTGRRARTDR